MTRNILVSRDFVEQALDDRFKIAQSNWGTEATGVFWEFFKDMVLDNDQLDGSVDHIVDNYVINSDCGDVEDMCQEGETVEDCIERLDPLWIVRDGDQTFIFLS